MAFYQFRQNNSGGRFKHDEKAGIGILVIIEATSAHVANARAEDIGLYFNGCESGMDCSCCGDRWSEAWREDGDDEPMYYDRPIADAAKDKSWSSGWWGLPCYVHYLDGRVERFDHEDSTTGAA